MTDDSTIVIESIQETNYGEKVVLDSPFEAKDAIKYLPWKEYSAEVAEHGSLKGKAQDRGTNTKTSSLVELFDAMEQYGFSDDFATHVTWDGDALGGNGAWKIDREGLAEAADFWQFLGYTVETADGVEAL